MIRRIFSRLSRNTASFRPNLVEDLEARQMLAGARPDVQGVIADNRGEVQITLSRFVRGIGKNSVKLFTSGADGVIGTADDVNVNSRRVSFIESSRRILIQANTDVNASYRVKLEAELLTTPAGVQLDGEFTGTFATGNGREGGDFNFVAKRDRSSTPIVRMTSTTGVMTVRVRKDAAPVSAGQFLDLSNSGKLDGFFWTRSIPGFVVQGGSLQVTGDGNAANDVVVNSAPTFPEETPRVLSNTRGTLSFARGGGGLASNQFFVNLADNNGNSPFNKLDVKDGPSDAVFTPFAQIIGSGGLAAIDAVAAKPTADLSSQLSIDPTTGVDDVPVNNTSQAQAGVNPNRDLIVVRRVAGLMKVSAL